MLLVLTAALPFTGPQHPGLRGSTASSSALFATARSRIAAAGGISRPEYFSYLAHQELNAGVPSAAANDFVVAFRAALDLPSELGTQAVKSEVESSAIEGLIEAGAEPQAENLAMQADAAVGRIADSLVTGEIASGRHAAAQSTWDALTRHKPREFPFRAAAALLPKTPREQGDSNPLHQALAASAQVRTPVEAHLALDFLETAAASVRGQDVRDLDTAIRRFASNLPASSVALWDQSELHERCAALVKRLGVGPPLPTAPVLPPRLQKRASRTVADDQTERYPTADLAPFDQAGAIQMRREYRKAASHPKHPAGPDGVSEYLAAAAPSYAARAAYDAFCKGKQHDAEALIELALTAADSKASRPRPPDAINFDGDVYWVYGIAAQMDFARALTHAEALPAEGWFAPLALAHVARFASLPSARPGRCFQILR